MSKWSDERKLKAKKANKFASKYICLWFLALVLTCITCNRVLAIVTLVTFPPILMLVLMLIAIAFISVDLIITFKLQNVLMGLACLLLPVTVVLFAASLFVDCNYYMYTAIVSVVSLVVRSKLNISNNKED